jgi:hypothetical protein
MADESHVIRGVNWREVFPFTQIFRAFRVAIHPTKLMLALLALLALYAGGRLLDSLWPVKSRAIPAAVTGEQLSTLLARRGALDGERAGTPELPAVHMGEVRAYETFSPGGRAGGRSFEDWITSRRAEIETDYARTVQDLKVTTDEAQAKRDAGNGGNLGAVKDALIKQRDAAVADAEKARKAALDAAKNDEDRSNAEKACQAAVRAAYATASARYEAARAVKGEGIFDQFFNYEVSQVNNVVWAVLGNDWLGGFAGNLPNRAAGPGVFQSVANFFVTGPWWLVRYHLTYFILFAIFFSIIWSIFGGAIARIAAIHVARDEKISISQALRFSTTKFPSFVFAPIIPLLIVLIVGLVVTVGGLIGNIPGIGPVIVGLFFFLALAAGFVMTLVLLGTGGGFNLMYPTIAVEGSDSFDAISRSFSYVYARPWRMLFYTLVAIVYGAICYLFVRLFLAIMLTLTHHFVGAGMFKDIAGNVPIDLWNTMWPTPTASRLPYNIDTLSLSGPQSLGAFLVALWVYLAIGLLGAFAISFYFSANTIIYYLMRREVDATELDDVYLEQSDEDFAEPAPPTTAPTAPGADASAAPATAVTTASTATTTGGAQVFDTPGQTPPTT